MISPNTGHIHMYMEAGRWMDNNPLYGIVYRTKISSFMRMRMRMPNYYYVGWHVEILEIPSFRNSS